MTLEGSKALSNNRQMTLEGLEGLEGLLIGFSIWGLLDHLSTPPKVVSNQTKYFERLNDQANQQESQITCHWE